ncbi:MAG: two-component sensor histidine kinase [Sphingobacteriales bacterium]|nr:two-component sensor histidine kinase [Sphingobacteriales bacterium]
MPEVNRKRQRRTTFIYCTLLTYVVAALVWWFVSLEKQNEEIARQQYANLQAQSEALPTLVLAEKMQAIVKVEKRNTGKYIAEGVTFLILILIGAIFVYRSIRKQFKLQLQQQNFMMAVTHELKTPIAVARLNLETLLKYSLDPEKQKKLIRNTLDETTRLNLLTNNILVSAQLEADRYNSTKEELDLSTLLKDCVQDFRKRFPDRVFEEEVEEDADIKGDSLLLQMLINNLLENAIKYSPREGKIKASLHKTPASIRLQIADEGPGIPEEEKSRIFSKFYRIGNESTRKAQGTGLGLYLCSKIALDHNGEISVSDNEPTGSNFAVIFKI